MANPKTNVLFTTLLVLGACGYLITTNHSMSESITSPTWIMPLKEYGTTGAFVGLLASMWLIFIGVVGITVYVFRWWVIIAIAILWIATRLSRRH